MRKKVVMVFHKQLFVNIAEGYTKEQAEGILSCVEKYEGNLELAKKLLKS